MKFTGQDDDDEEVIMDDFDHTPAPGTGNQRTMRRSAAISLKKMKIDEEQQVKDLFEREQAKDSFTFDISTKKYVFKLIGECTKEASKSKVAITSVWQKYFQLDDEAQKNPSTNKHYFQNK